MGSYGQITATVYGLIRDSQHAQAIKVLEEQLCVFPDNLAGLSLLGYCHYYQGDFHSAASTYEKLTQLQPNESKYQMCYAQSLYKASMLEIADEACMGIEGNKQQFDNLQACIKYEQGDITGSRIIWEENADENIDSIINVACCFYKEGSFGEAYVKFTQVQTIGGFQPKIAYNRAVCLYQMKRFGQALKILDEIIQHGVREHPELGVGSYMEGMELCSIGNSASLKESHLVEAFNLKAAIDYKSGNIEGAKAAMMDMPPRAEEELDPVTLHNQALINMDIDPSSGFRKLNFLLQNPPFPPESYRNLLLLCCKPTYGFYDLAATVMMNNTDLSCKHISQDLQIFLEAMIILKTSQEEAYQKFSDLANRYGETLRRLNKLIQDSQLSCDHEAHTKGLSEYEGALEIYMPAVMAMAKVFWDKGNYAQVERIFYQYSDICSEHPIWQLNLSHTIFMQENRYEEAIEHYEPIIKKAGDKILTVAANVLANLCVSYIMNCRVIIKLSLFYT